MNGHTRGPWMDDYNFIVPSGDPTNIIATVWFVDKLGRNSWKLGAETRANRNLIVAAPDLLEALEAMVIAAGAVAVPHDGERKTLQMGVDMALKVIARARGEKP